MAWMQYAITIFWCKYDLIVNILWVYVRTGLFMCIGIVSDNKTSASHELHDCCAGIIKKRREHHQSIHSWNVTFSGSLRWLGVCISIYAVCVWYSNLKIGINQISMITVYKKPFRGGLPAKNGFWICIFSQSYRAKKNSQQADTIQIYSNIGSLKQTG